MNPYEKFKKNELILRDELAIDRTILANERTLLAYIRTSLTLIIAGLSFIHFIKEGIIFKIGIFLVPLGIFAGVFGYIRYFKMKRIINTARNKSI